MVLVKAIVKDLEVVWALAGPATPLPAALAAALLAMVAEIAVHATATARLAGVGPVPDEDGAAEAVAANQADHVQVGAPPLVVDLEGEDAARRLAAKVPLLPARPGHLRVPPVLPLLIGAVAEGGVAAAGPIAAGEAVAPRLPPPHAAEEAGATLRGRRVAPRPAVGAVREGAAEGVGDVGGVAPPSLDDEVDVVAGVIEGAMLVTPVPRRVAQVVLPVAASGVEPDPVAVEGGRGHAGLDGADAPVLVHRRAARVGAGEAFATTRARQTGARVDAGEGGLLPFVGPVRPIRPPRAAVRVGAAATPGDVVAVEAVAKVQDAKEVALATRRGLRVQAPKAPVLVRAGAVADDLGPNVRPDVAARPLGVEGVPVVGVAATVKPTATPVRVVPEVPRKAAARAAPVAAGRGAARAT